MITSSLSAESASYLDSMVSTEANDKLLAGQQLGEEAFLKILVTQLQNQDPLEPVSDTDFIAQLAQFSSLEQITQIAENTAVSSEDNLVMMDQLNEVITGLQEIYSMNNERLDNLENTNQEVINQLININKALESY